MFEKKFSKVHFLLPDTSLVNYSVNQHYKTRGTGFKETHYACTEVQPGEQNLERYEVRENCSLFPELLRDPFLTSRAQALVPPPLSDPSVFLTEKITEALLY